MKDLLRPRKKGMHGDLLCTDMAPTPFAPPGTKTPDDEVEELAELAYRCMGGGDLSNALKHYNRAIAISPNNPVLLVNRAWIHNSQGDQHLALVDVSQAIKFGAEEWFVYNLLGNIHVSRKEDDRALVAFQKAYDLDPNNLTSIVCLGGSLSEVGRHEEALEYLTDVIKRDLDKQNLAAAHNSIGSSLLELTEFKEGAIHFSRVIELLQNRPIAYNNLGYCLIELGKYEEALIPLEKRLIKLEPSSEAYCNIARAYMRLGEYDKAKNNLSNAIEINPQNPTPYSILGDLNILTQRPEEAEANYRKAIQIVGDKPKHKRGRNDYRAVIRALKGLSTNLGLEVTGQFAKEAVDNRKLTQAMVDYIMR